MFVVAWSEAGRVRWCGVVYVLWREAALIFYTETDTEMMAQQRVEQSLKRRLSEEGSY